MGFHHHADRHTFSYSAPSKDQMVRLRSEFGVYGTDTGCMWPRSTATEHRLRTPVDRQGDLSLLATR